MNLLSVVSARPNFVKLAAIHHAIAARDDASIRHTIVHTGQHYDPLFSDVFFEQLSLPQPEHNLGIHSGTHEEVIAQTQQAIEPLLAETRPDFVLVYGDVNGAVGAAHAAASLGIPIVHVEAGLRSFDMDMPEERNRIAIDQLSTLLLCSEKSGVDNLHAEGITDGVHLVGNTMIDTLMRMRPYIDAEQLPEGIPEHYAVLTMHRPSNVDTDEALQRNVSFLNEVASHCPLVLPMHHRMTTALDRSNLRAELSSAIHCVDPLGYIPFLRLARDAQFILTDSGGLQEEAVLLHKRCFTLRLNTERPSTIESGSNILIDIDQKGCRDIVLQYVQLPHASMINIPQLWDGYTGERSINILYDA